MNVSNRPVLTFAKISAGFPNPAEDAGEIALDLNEKIIKHPAATFFMRVSGSSMQDAHIIDGDLVVVDRSLEPKHRDIIVAYIDGDFTLKRFIKNSKGMFLVPENTEYAAIQITEHSDFSVWGVVISVIREVRSDV